MQHAIVNRMNYDVMTSAANIFLIDISQDEVAGVRDLLVHQPGVEKKFESIPIVSARITSINSVPVDQLRVKNYPKRLRTSVSVTWADSAPEGIKVLQGKWWEKSDADGLAVVDHVARRLNLSGARRLILSRARPRFILVSRQSTKRKANMYLRAASSYCRRGRFRGSQMSGMRRSMCSRSRFRSWSARYSLRIPR